LIVTFWDPWLLRNSTKEYRLAAAAAAAAGEAAAAQLLLTTLCTLVLHLIIIFTATIKDGRF
jgi:hypothetical protein